jgi:PAS domain S-box-containing protein
MIRNTNGDLIGVLETLEDISERKKAEGTLRESEERYRILFNEALDGICLADAETGLIIDCNQALADLVDRERAELIGQSQTILHPPYNDPAPFSPTFRQHLTIEEGQTLETQVVTRTGIIREVEIKANHLNLQGRKMLNGIFHDMTERNKVEDALRRSEEKYRMVTENASDVIWTMDLNLRFTYVTPSNEKLTGYTTEKFLKLSLGELLTPESIERALQSFTAEMQLENSKEKDLSRSVTLQLNEIRANDTIFPIEVRMCFLRDSHDNPIGILGITRDTTERKKAEDALKKSEEKFVKAFESSPIAIAVTRMSDGKFIEANEAIQKLFGYSHDEFLARSSIELGLWVDINDRSRLVEELAKTSSVHNHEYRFRAKAGNVIIARYSAEIIDFSDERCILSVLIDVTEKKRAEELLRESEEKYRSIVENTKDVIMLTNPDGQVSYISPACVEVLGYNPDDLVGIYLEIFYPDDIEKVHNALSSSIQGVSGSNLEYRILTKNGKTKWVSHSWSPIFKEDHKLKFIVNVVRDITESKIAEQTLKTKIEELEKYKNITVNREVKMVDLKNEINELCKQLNQKPKYPNI